MPASSFRAVLALVAAQRDADDVDVELLDRAAQRAAPATSDVEQRHARLEVQLAEREVELRVLRLFEGHVVAFEVRAGVPHGRVEEQREELIRHVVDRLGLLVVRRQSVLDIRHTIVYPLLCA